ncbi:MAG: hypothetical protein KA447_07320 [Pyrinomonadaceae bacterium]|nr:hypothetical protein [Pyrinomonadaceae bacterium]
MNYSSKVWRINANLAWWNYSPLGAVIYHTNTTPYFAERSAAGWTSTLLPPHIIEKLELYNNAGEPISSLFTGDQLVEMNMTENSASLELCHRYCFYQGGILSWCTSWSCTTNGGGCNPGEACGGGGGSGGGDPGDPWTPPVPQARYYIKRVRVQLSDGSTHEFRKDDTIHPYCVGGPGDPAECQNTNGEDRSGTFIAVDGSAMRLERGVTVDGQVKDVLHIPGGDRYIFPRGSGSGTLQGIYTPAEKLIDVNGNISAFNQTNNTWNDTVGRTVTDFLPHNWIQQTQTAQVQEFSLPGLGTTGGLEHKLVWDNLANSFDPDLPEVDRELSFSGRHSSCFNNLYTTISPALFAGGETNTRICANLNGVTPVKFDPVVLKEIGMPDGSKYKFRFNRFGEITRIDYPTGSYERFEYGRIPAMGSEASATYDQTNRGVKKRWVYPGEGQTAQYWEYDAAIEGANYVVTTTSPDGSYSKRYLYQSVNTWFGYDDPKSGMVAEERIFDSNGQLRSRTLNDWITKDTSVSGSIVSRDPRVKRSLSLAFDPGSANALATLSQTEFDEYGNSDPTYFSHLNVERTKGYHYVLIDDKTTVDNEALSWTTIESWFPQSKLAAVTETDYSYDPNYKDRGIIGLPIRTRSLDPANPNPNTPLAKTETIYDNALPNSASGYGYAIQTYGTGNAFDCATASPAKICWENPNGPGGNIDLSYRGLPTTSRVWDAANNVWIESHTQYDQFGNAVKARDPIGNEASTEFGSQYKFAYASSKTTPAPDPTNTTGSNQPSTVITTYDLNTGLPLTIVDEFGQVTETEYDAVLRPFRLKPIVVNGTATGPITETTYGAPDSSGSLPEAQRYVKIRKQIDATNWDESTTWFDGLGRTIKTVAKDSQGDVIVETHYDSLGRVDRVTNPYRAGDTVYWSKTRYDELGRAVETFAPAELENLANAQSLGVTSFGISSVANYVGTVVTTTDASGRKGRSITNGIGQLIRVDEPVATGGTADADLGAIGTPAQPTIYKYDVFGKMVEVIQGVQHRYFKYDALGRLLRVRQPEQEINPNLATSGNPGNDAWTAGFAYDLIGNVVRATDANGVNIINEYDKAGRVVKRCYTKPNINTTATTCAQIASGDVSIDTPAVSFWYDGKGLAQVQTPHNFAKGKLTMVTSSVSETQNTLFDNFGRITESKQITDGNTYTSRYTYNFAGALVEEEYPSGRKVKNEFETDGDLARVTSAKNAASVFAQYVSNFSYTASGGISQMRLGNGRWETAKFNPRLQVKELGLGASATDTGLWKVGFEYGELDANGNIDEGKNTGNIARQTLTVPGTSFVQSYRYDSLYRIKEAKEKTGSNTNWIQNWDYDRYGNRIGFTQNIAGITTAPNPSIDTDSNRFNLNQGFSYDKNGNVVRDVDPVTNHVRDFVFNGDNKQSHVKDVTNGYLVVGTYYYDGEGKRVKKVTDTETTIFVYSSGKLIAEYSTQISQTPAVAYTTTDHLGSPRVITDATGQVTSRRDFMPFGEDLNVGVGNRTGETGLKYSMPGDNIRQKFTGYQKDTETSLDFAEARMYENRFGRFTAVDPLLASGKSANPQTFNRYVYVGNAPLLMIDPSGMFGDYFSRSGKYLGSDGKDDGLIYFATATRETRKHTWIDRSSIDPTTLAAVLLAQDQAVPASPGDEYEAIHFFANGGTQALADAQSGSWKGVLNIPSTVWNTATTAAFFPFSSIRSGQDGLPELFIPNRLLVQGVRYENDREWRFGAQVTTGALMAPAVFAAPFAANSSLSIASNASTATTWNQFQRMTAGQFSSRADAAQAWSAYKSANGIVSSSIVRSEAQRSLFLTEAANSGMNPKWMNQWLRTGNTPPGYVVDHIKPLSVGGADLPSNMRLVDQGLHNTHHRFYRPWER